MMESGTGPGTIRKGHYVPPRTVDALLPLPVRQAQWDRMWQLLLRHPRTQPKPMLQKPTCLAQDTNASPCCVADDTVAA